MTSSRTNSSGNVCRRVFMVPVTALLISCLTFCNRSPDTPAQPQETNRNVTVPKPKASLPPCPDGTYPMLQSGATGTGHHKVFLLWKASAPPPSEPDSLGYCVYRTQTKNTAQKCPKGSPDCEKVTNLPVPDTRCVDDLVKDDTTYHYVTIAINAAGMSKPTKEAVAKIPAAGQQQAGPADAASYPACRLPAVTNQPAR